MKGRKEKAMNNEAGSTLYDTVTIEGYEGLVDYLSKLENGEDGWVYRAQPSPRDLETTLERACKSSGFVLKECAAGIEKNMIRQFSRIYDGDDRQEVQGDVLYCLSLMRHYGAPARLLDFTYSKYVATYFALEYAYDSVPTNNGKRSCAIWCIQTAELYRKVECVYTDTEVPRLLKKRDKDDTRKNESFEPLYMNNQYRLVMWENPVQIHKRLHLQQGVFLCPGNVELSFMENLLCPYGNQKTDKIRKVTCNLEPLDLQRGFELLMRMNLTRESLFPGLDGFAKSMQYQVWFYKKLAKWRNDESKRGEAPLANLPLPLL